MPTCLIAVGGPLPHADTAGGGGAALNDIWPMAPVSVDAMRRSASSSLRGGTHGFASMRTLPMFVLHMFSRVSTLYTPTPTHPPTRAHHMDKTKRSHADAGDRCTEQAIQSIIEWVTDIIFCVT